MASLSCALFTPAELSRPDQQMMDSSKNVPFFTSLSMSGQGQIPPPTSLRGVQCYSLRALQPPRRADKCPLRTAEPLRVAVTQRAFREVIQLLLRVTFRALRRFYSLHLTTRGPERPQYPPIFPIARVSIWENPE